MQGILPLWCDQRRQEVRFPDQYCEYIDIIAADDDLEVMTGLLAFALALPLCAPLQFIFLSYVAARCVIAWPEITHLRKHERRTRMTPQGFPVGMTAPPPPPIKFPPRPPRA